MSVLLDRPLLAATVRQRPPNFIIAGAGESGTSWLSACLASHPQVYMPKEMRPEPHFFYKTQEFNKGFNYYLNRFFDAVPDSALAVGERSSSYIFSPLAIERMAMDLPDAKIIVMLREPVMRAYSNWRFTVQSGLEVESFERAIALEAKRIREETSPFWREIQPYAYLGRSQYGEQIENLLQAYSANQVLILNSDQVKQDEPGSLVRVCRFLGIDERFSFPTPGTFPTSSVRNRRLQSWLRGIYQRDFDLAIENTRREQPDPAVRKPFIDWILKQNLTQKHPQLSPKTRRKLLEYFEDSNKRLAPYIDWDPLQWSC